MLWCRAGKKANDGAELREFRADLLKEQVSVDFLNVFDVLELAKKK